MDVALWRIRVEEMYQGKGHEPRPGSCSPTSGGTWKLHERSVEGINRLSDDRETGLVKDAGRLGLGFGAVFPLSGTAVQDFMVHVDPISISTGGRSNTQPQLLACSILAGFSTLRDKAPFHTAACDPPAGAALSP